MPLMGAAAEGAEDMIGPRVGRAKRVDRPNWGGLCWDVKEERKEKRDSRRDDDGILLALRCPLFFFGASEF